MRMILLVVGKTTDPHIEALIENYTQRLVHYVQFSFQVLPELKNARSLSFDTQKQLEGEMILKAVPPQAAMWLLDEHGTEYRSIEFAAFVQTQLNAGRDIYLVIGGPYGFSPQVYERATGKLSLSKMTFSHQLIRVLFVEQLYRAFTILRHEPYHHE